MSIIAFILIVQLTIALYLQFNNKSPMKVNLNLQNVFLLAVVGYLVIPIAEIVAIGDITPYNKSFIYNVLLVLIFLNLGSLFSKIIKVSGKYNNISITPLEIDRSERVEFLIVLGASLFAILMLCTYVVLNKGGFYQYFTVGYSNRTGTEESSIISSLVFSTIAYAIIFNYKGILRYRSSRLLAHACTLIFALSFIIGGNRNFAMMVLIGAVVGFFAHKKFNILNVLAIMFFSIIGLGLIAVFREHGIMNVIHGDVYLSRQDVMKYIFSFRDGELGTTAKFAEYPFQVVKGFHFPHAFGYSYIVIAIANLMPRAIWPSKPTTYADYFSQVAFGDSKGLGFGFSPIYEAQVNFFFMWPIVFFIVGYLLMRSSKRASNTKNPLKYALMLVTIASITLNYFRIDFATCFKFFMMTWIFVEIFYWSLSKKSWLSFIKEKSDANH